MIKNFVGLLKKRNGYHFLNQVDLLSYFIREQYPDKCVLVLYDCKILFNSIPKLLILKRDDFTTYLMGLQHEFVIMDFDNITKAEDWAFSNVSYKIKFSIFSNGKLIRNEKGLISNGKGR